MRRVRAVVFDGDGVLFQSMELNADAYRLALGSLGVVIVPPEVFRNEGLRSKDLLRTLAGAHGIALTEPQLDELVRLHRSLFAAHGRMPLYPDAEPVVRRLRDSGVRLALVTSNWRDIARQNLGPISSAFEVVVSAEDVTNAKPDPEPYSTALAHLGVGASEAVAVENAPLGITSAKAAGLQVVALSTTNPPDELAAADLVIRRLGELRDAIRTLGWEVR